MTGGLEKVLEEIEPYKFKYDDKVVVLSTGYDVKLGDYILEEIYKLKEDVLGPRVFKSTYVGEGLPSQYLRIFETHTKLWEAWYNKNE